MKKIFITILSVCTVAVYAQNILTSNNTLLPNDINVFNQINSKNSSRSLTYDEITGSPYINKSFVMAKFGDTYESAPARYNTYNDEIEYKKDDKVYVLPKNSVFPKVQFNNTNDVLVNLDTNDELSGYFYEIVNGKYSLYKKIKTRFVDTVPARNSYDSEKPAMFKTYEPMYYIKTPNGYIKKPKNAKEVIKELSDRKDDLETYFKSNKTKFDKQEDLAKLVNFLNGKS